MDKDIIPNLDMDYISFISRNNVKVYSKKDVIKNNSVILSNILNLDGHFKEPEKLNDSYIFFNELHSSSIILIIKFLTLELNGKDISQIDETKYQDLFDYIKLMDELNFFETVLFCHPFCIDIPTGLYKIAKCNYPKSKSEDKFDEFVFFDYILDDSICSYKQINHDILNSYVNDGWEIVSQTFLLDKTKESKVTLRRKIK